MALISPSPLECQHLWAGLNLTHSCQCLPKVDVFCIAIPKSNVVKLFCQSLCCSTVYINLDWGDHTRKCLCLSGGVPSQSSGVQVARRIRHFTQRLLHKDFWSKLWVQSCALCQVNICPEYLWAQRPTFRIWSWSAPFQLRKCPRRTQFSRGWDTKMHD